MKISLLLPGTVLATVLISTVTFAAPASKPAAEISVAPLQVKLRWRERFAMLPGATAYVALYAELAGGEALPLAAAATEVGAGGADVALAALPIELGPNLKYRLRAWIVRDGRVIMRPLAPTTYVYELTTPVTMLMHIAPKDEPMPLPHPVSNSEYKLRGQVLKLDRRGLSPDAQVIVQLRDVSLMDAPSKLLGETTIDLAGRQLPVDYDMTLVGFDLKPNGRYAVSARVMENGEATYITDTHFGFDGSKHDQVVDVRVVPLRRTE